MNRVKSFFLPLILMLSCMGPLLLMAQPKAAPRLYIKGETLRPDYVEVGFEINHAGFVELHLFSPEGKRLWIKGTVSDRGDAERIMDYIRIPRAPMEAGKRYTYQLKYKGKVYNGSFYNGA